MHHILGLINELAIYEHELQSVEATEEKLLTTLGFNSEKPGPAYAKTLLLFCKDDPGMYVMWKRHAHLHTPCLHFGGLT